MAPAVLAFAWGVQFVDPTLGEHLRDQIFNAGYFVAFLFLLCGAARLARFNVQKNPIPKNPGRPDRKYFVGLPIPAAAAMVAAVVFASDARADRLVAAFGAVAGPAGAAGIPDGQHLALLQLQRHQSQQALHAAAHHRAGRRCIYAIWNWPQPVLLGLATCLCGQRHRDPHRRYRAPPLAARPSTSRSGASGWLIHTTSPWSAANRCWAAKSATSLPRSAPDLHLRLIADVAEEPGTLTRVGDEPALVTGLNAESLAGGRAVILAGSPESSRSALELAGDPPDVAIIDLTYPAEERPDARLRAPSVEGADETGRGRGPRDRAPGRHRAGPVPAPAACQRPDPPLRDPDLRPGQRARRGGRAKNCSSRPSACSPSRTCPRPSSTRSSASTCWRAMAKRRRSGSRNPNCASSATWPPCWRCRAKARARPCRRCA